MEKRSPKPDFTGLRTGLSGSFEFYRTAIIFVIIFWVIVWWELRNVVFLQSEFWTSPARVWTPNSGRLAFHDRSSCFILNPSQMISSLVYVLSLSPMIMVMVFTLVLFTLSFSKPLSSRGLRELR